ncbi:MAG: type II toxin-antitoxin system VapC family toxin [Azoarcus sp.]|nr:type II toxin-antitoxin system VapC family toxin [Azoarcus sp.]
MTIILDTNVLVRLIVHDDEKQVAVAQALVIEARQIVIPLVAFCETVWVLMSLYKMSRADIADAFDIIVDTSTIFTQRSAVEAGISALRANGDFADAVIAFDGAMQGGDIFATFDKKAAAIAEKSGIQARLLKA